MTLYRLGDLCEMQSGGTPRRDDPTLYDGNIPWAKIGDMNTPSGVVLQTEENITSDGLASIGGRLFPKGIIMLAMYGASVGKMAVAGREISMNQAILGIRPRDPDKLDNRFLFRWLEFIRPKLIQDARGGAQPNISKGLVEALELSLPAIDAQKRIAEILDKADAIRRKRQEAIALTEQLLRSTFLEMFGDPVTNPKRWPISSLGDIIAELRYGTSEKCSDYPEPGMAPVLRIPNIVSGSIDTADLKYAQLTERELRQLTLTKGDILFVRSNGNPEYIGRCAVFHGSADYAFASYLIRGRMREDARYAADFAQAVLSFPTFRSQLVREARTTAGNYNISTEGLRTLRLIHPSEELQDAFLRKSEKIAKVATRHASHFAASVTLFNSLVQRAFSGQL